jgi:hypothetical protein
MNTWFECKAKYVKIDENGREKKVNEAYLLDAVSFSEAESRIYKELETMVSGEFTVTKIAKTNVAEIIPSEDGDRWFKAKVSFITIDEEKGKEKRTAQYVLVLAKTVRDAYEKVVENMQGMMADFEINAVNESLIMDVFPYFGQDDDIPDNLRPLNEDELLADNSATDEDDSDDLEPLDEDTESEEE